MLENLIKDFPLQPAVANYKLDLKGEVITHQKLEAQTDKLPTDPSLSELQVILQSLNSYSGIFLLLIWVSLFA